MMPRSEMSVLFLLLTLVSSWCSCVLLVAAQQQQDATADPRSNITTSERPKYPTIDGSGNNERNPAWGKSGTPYSRIQVPDAAYPARGDGLAGANRPSAREITLALLNKPYFKATSSFNSSYLLTAMGQLVATEVTRAAPAAPATAAEESAPIKVPPGDPAFWRFNGSDPVAQGSRTFLPFERSGFKRLKPGGPREQLNGATAWIDASCLYGEDPKLLKAIRLGAAGRLLTDESKLVPFNVEPATGQPKHKMKNVAGRVPQTQLRVGGAPNLNQNPLQMSLITVLMREHNRRARLIEDANPDLSDDQIFNEARKMVIGHVQRIALVDYLSALGIAVPPYKGYNASADPSIDNFFASVAYRYGHSTINDVVLRLDETWSTHPIGHMTLRSAYYNPNEALEAGIEPIIRGMLVQPQAKIEPRWSTAVSGAFMGDPAANGTDLAAINIQRGRDHGIPDYNTCRRALGLPAAKTFADITPDKEIAGILKQLYGNVNNIDAYVGGLAEPHEGASHVGPLFTASMKEQFGRLRDADFWYYENGLNNKLYNQSEIDEIRTTSLRDIIMRNTNIKDLPPDIWTATGSMTCPAGSGGAGGSRNTPGHNKLAMSSLLGGTASLDVQPAQDPGWVKVAVTAAGEGWLGFAVADPDSGSAMIGSDMVVGRMVDGAPEVHQCHAASHVPPTIGGVDPTRIKDIKFEQSGGRVSLEFQRPTSGGGEGSHSMPVGSRLRLIVARGPNNDLTSLNGYHGSTNREIIDLPEGLFGTASTAAADPKAIVKRRAHGVLMAVNFIVVFPLGALAARQLRSHWLASPAIRAAMFYVHIITQVAGTACATAGFIIATNTFNVPYGLVQYHHGVIGIATLVLVYSQLLLGFIRPTATAPTHRRHLWDVAHSTMGRAAMLLGLANVALGIVIFSYTYGGRFGVWAGCAATGLGAITLLQHILDRQEKYAVLRNDREMLLASAEQEKSGHGQLDGFESGDFGGQVGQVPDGLPTGHSYSLPVDSQPSLGYDAAAAAGHGVAGHAGLQHPGYSTTPTSPAMGTVNGGGGAGVGNGGLGTAQQGGSLAAAPGGPKLTATLLQRHEASSGGLPPGAAVEHPAFAPAGQQSGDISHLVLTDQQLQAARHGTTNHHQPA